MSTATRLSRLISWLSVVFAILAASLAVLGVYSVLSYAVAQRTREFAIRAAVGASRGRLVTMVLREGALMSGAGIIIGTALAKIERGHEQDREDVRTMLARGLVRPEAIRDAFSTLEPRLYRYPAIDAAAFRRAVDEMMG